MDTSNWIAASSAGIALVAMAVTIAQTRKATQAATRSANADEAIAKLAERQLEAATRYLVPWKVEQRSSHAFVLMNQGDKTETNVRISHTGIPEAELSRLDSPCIISPRSEHAMMLNHRAGKITVNWTPPGETRDREWSAPVVLTIR